MSGFRTYKTNWVSGQTYEDSPLGVKACLEDIANKFLLDSEYHGWSLDTINCPDNEAVKLTPSYGVYAMFFTHISGAKLMLALNYRGLSPWFESFKERSDNKNISTQNTPDCSFVKEKMQDLSSNYSTSGWNPSNGNGTYNTSQLFPMYGGLFACIIPQQSLDSFDASINMTSESFIPASATKVVCTNPALVNMYKYNYSGSKNCGVLNANFCQSLIKRGTTKSFSTQNGTDVFSTNYGTYNGDWCEYGLMIDEDCDLFVLSRSYNNTYPYRYPHWAGIVTSTHLPDDSVDSNFIVLQPNRFHGGYQYPGVSITDGGSVGSSSYNSEYSFYANPMCGISETGCSTYYETSSNIAANSNSCRLSGKSGTILTNGSYSEVMFQPFPYGLSRGYTNPDTNEFCYAMQPFALVGGKFKVRGIINPDNIRMIKLSSNAIMEGTTLSGGVWMSVGYIMTFSGQSAVNADGGTYTTDSNQSSYVAHLVVKIDSGNAESMFT